MKKDIFDFISKHGKLNKKVQKITEIIKLIQI